MSDHNKDYIYLNNVRSPEDLKALPEEAIEVLAEEIRHALVERVAENGGHLASNLGVVEMTLALHRVFNSPKDHIIFDVGHQSYVHKMLTGRYEKMDTLRTAGGISGFTKRSESEHDAFGAGHSSTSLSAALAFAISDKINGSDAYTIAVIGDGSYTGGMIHEALNNCRKDIRLIIIMNENEMSISKNIGRFARHLSKIRNKASYFKTKKVTGAFLKHIPLIGKKLFFLVRGVKKSIKNALYGSNYFESMGLTYMGPVNGNDYREVENMLREAIKLEESVVIHVKTKKGYGYAPAEEAPDKYHGLSPKGAAKPDRPNFSHVMGEALAAMAEQDDKICAITAAMSDGTGLNAFRDKHTKRFFDVGIAEEHAMTFASGLAANGMKPYFAVYSSFLQRAYDNIIHDAALQKLPVKICIDRAGLSDADGATHHGIFDVAFLSHIPDVKIFTPITDHTLRQALKEANELNTPCAIRYPNACENERVVREFYSTLPEKLGYAKNFEDPESLDCVIITHGRIVTEALKARDELAKDGIKLGVILLEVLKPYDKTAADILDVIPERACKILFLEEEIKYGGMGMILSEEMKRYDKFKNKRVSIMATDDTFVERHTGCTLYDDARISAKYIIDAIKNEY